MEYPGNLFVVAAPSGAGKSSLVKALLELDARLA
ncbi:MAG: guanylate kinase, partial [Myxococcaceae bacterium]